MAEGVKIKMNYSLVFFGNVKTDQEKRNFSKSFGIKGEEPF